MPFEVIASTYEENRDFDEKDYGNRPEEYVLATAMGKAMQVAKGLFSRNLLSTAEKLQIFPKIRAKSTIKLW